MSSYLYDLLMAHVMEDTPCFFESSIDWNFPPNSLALALHFVTWRISTHIVFRSVHEYIVVKT